MSKMRTYEDLIADLGGMGKFQVAVTFLINLCQLFCGWSMLLMSYVGTVPDYYCLHKNVSTADNVNNTDIMNVCDINGTSCSSYIFTESHSSVIEEWELICDLKWVKQIITSVQMAGVLLGALLVGQISDTFGRKISLYGFNVFHIITNVIAAFSTSWIMFAIMRFFIGIGIGSILVIAFSFAIEWLPMKWRPLQPIIPGWALGVSFFAAGAYVLDNWSHLQIACAILSVPSLLGYFFVPESIRWLALKGRMDDAFKVLDQIGRVNGKDVPSDAGKILQNIVDMEMGARENAKAYSYSDLFKKKSLVKLDLILWISWFSLSLCFYGISFGVSSLSGNIYLNIVLLAILELPIRFSSYYWLNRFGRKVTTVSFLVFSTLPAAGCLFTQIFASEEIRPSIINGFCLVAKMMVGSAWACVYMWTSELYPTVVRTLGLGWASFGARLGGVVSPFLINMDEMAIEAYTIMAVMLLLTTILCSFLDETKGKELTDSLHNKNSETKSYESTKI